MVKFKSRTAYTGRNATTEKVGSARFATQAEANAGTADDLIVSPSILDAAIDALVEAATTSSAGIVQLDDDLTDGVSSTVACTSNAAKTYADALAIAGAPVASDANQGIGWTATDAQCVAGTANDAANAYLVSADNLAAIFASPNAAIGGTAAVAGTFTDLTADGTGAVTLDGNAASQLTCSAGDLTVDSAAGSLILTSGENVADSIVISADAGGIDILAPAGAAGQDIDIVNTGGSVNITATENAADSVVITSSAGGIDILASGSGGAGEDIDIVCTGGSVNLSGTENVADAVTIAAANGGIDITCGGAAGEDIDLANTAGSIHLSAGEAATDAINIDATAGGVDVDAAGQVNIASSQNAADSVVIVSSAGGVDILASGSGGAGEDIDIVCTGGSVNISGTENVADAVTIAAANGGIDITCGGAAGEDIDIANTAGSLNLSAGEAIATAVTINASAGGMDISTGGAGLDMDLLATGGSINISATEAAGDAIVLHASDGAGGIQLQAGSAGILIGNQADCAVIDVGDLAPTASRTVTIAGGTVVTASVTDLVDIAPDGATTNADSVKQVDVLTGTVATGQSLLNLATGAITSGTHTVSIQSGNAAAGTVACNISTGTGTKTVSVGNADAGTTINLDGVLAVNNNVNAAVTINDGTSTGTVTIGSANAGAITLDSSAGISLDGAGASNFACSAGDMTVDSSAGSLNLLAGEAAADAVVIQSDNGGIDILAPGAGAGLDIDITNTGGSVNITATEAAGDAIVINASDAAGGIDLQAGTGSVSFNSGMVVPVLSANTAGAPYTLDGGDYFVTTDSTGGAFQINMPAAPATGQVYIIYDGAGQAAAGGAVTVSGNGNNVTMEGASAATYVINGAYESVMLVYNGTVWCGRYST